MLPLNITTLILKEYILLTTNEMERNDLYLNEKCNYAFFIVIILLNTTF